MNPAILWALVAVIFLLLSVLLIFEKRRQRQREQFAIHLEDLEREGKLDELDEVLAEEEAIDQESLSQAFTAFVKGRGTRRLTAFSLYSIIHGIVAFGLIGFVLYMVFKSALVDPIVRLILLATIGVGATIFGIAAALKRAKQEKELLTSPRDRVPPNPG